MFPRSFSPKQAAWNLPMVLHFRFNSFNPIGSMGLVYLPTFTIKNPTKCRQIYRIPVPWIRNGNGSRDAFFGKSSKLHFKNSQVITLQGTNISIHIPPMGGRRSSSSLPFKDADSVTPPVGFLPRSPTDTKRRR